MTLRCTSVGGKSKVAKKKKKKKIKKIIRSWMRVRLISRITRNLCFSLSLSIESKLAKSTIRYFCDWLYLWCVITYILSIIYVSIDICIPLYVCTCTRIIYICLYYTHNGYVSILILNASMCDKYVRDCEEMRNISCTLKLIISFSKFKRYDTTISFLKFHSFSHLLSTNKESKIHKEKTMSTRYCSWMLIITNNT